MKAIYSCKLYRASTRKDKIKAAIADPVNAELVAQLRSYLDADSQELVRKAHLEKKKEQVDNIEKEQIHSDNIKESNPSASNRSSERFGSPLGPRPSLSEKFDMLSSEEDDVHPNEVDVLDTPEFPESDGLDDTAVEEIEESTAINGVEDALEDDSFDLVAEVRNILESENISRMLIKKNELWIYYTDDVNLNNIMGPVVEKLSNSGLDYLDFNRLARSDNAIVFQIKEKSNGEESTTNN